ncbi:MAG: Ig-like domain-containing protein [Patescibacteria group bacterium]|jgi:hypothetical protein
MAGGFLFSAPQVFAQADQTAQVAATAGFGTADLPTIIGQIISVFLGLLGVVFLVLTIYAGTMWMTAAGDPKKVEKAKNILIQAAVGLLITISAYGITTFIVNAITGGTGGGGGGTGGGSNGGVSVESLSGALGAGPIRDHYPTRNQTDVARNAKIMITFKEAIDPASVTVNSVKIFPASTGVTGALTDTVINFTDDHKTFVFRPAAYLGSPTAKVQYTVQLTTDIKNAGGAKLFSGSYSSGYKWSFETGTVLDLTPPTIVSVTPANSGAYARNIVVQATFSEPVDPTSASGVRTSSGGFSNIGITSNATVQVPGEYQISNGYTSVTFISAEPCGTNSCGEKIVCLPASSSLNVTVKGASTTANPPQADTFPYDGVVDMAGNSFDGNHDGTAGDFFGWSFTTTGDIALAGPKIVSVSPNISEEDVPLDQPVTITFGDVLMTSSVSQDTVQLSNKEQVSGISHEMWFSPSTSYLTSDDQVVTSAAQIPAKTVVEVTHGTFLQSVDGKSYLYGSTVTSGLLNQYQNCYVPGAGPDAVGGLCGVSAAEPYCCNGIPSSSACILF